MRCDLAKCVPNFCYFWDKTISFGVKFSRFIPIKAEDVHKARRIKKTTPQQAREKAVISSRMKSSRGLVQVCVVVGTGALGTTFMASAQQTYIFTPQQGFTQGSLPESQIKRRTTILAERYEPTIWVDPDGCEHWVMDDGWEGYMTPHVTRDGIPVCRGQSRSKR